MMGFESTQDFLGKSFDPKVVGIVSITFGSLGIFVEQWTGISVFFWMFLTLASIFDVMFGVFTNVTILRQPFETHKFFRGIFKAFVVLFIIVITNTLHMGVVATNITPEFVKTTFVHTSSVIHYSFVMLISLYLLVGIAENGAKLEIPVFKSVTRMLRVKIKRVENMSDGLGDSPTESNTEDPDDTILK